MAPEFMRDRSSGDFVTFLTMAASLAKPIRQLSQINSVIQRGLSAASSIFSLLDEPGEVDCGEKNIAARDRAYRIRQCSLRLCTG
jgi:subfamily B ATP-binding cassette protein MsbA